MVAGLPDNGVRFLQFSITVRPRLGAHTDKKGVCMCAHTHTHAFTRSHWFSTPLTTLGCLPRGRFLLLLVCSSSLTAGATNLNHHFALAHKISSIRFLVADFASSRFSLATSPDNQFPFGICPNSKHHTHRNFRLLLHCAALPLLLVFVS